MRWLTRSEVKAAGNVSELAAAFFSLKHWMQIKTAGAKQLRLALCTYKVDTYSGHCALCVRHLNIDECSLNPGDEKCIGDCCQEWINAKGTLSIWRAGNTTYKDLQKAITPLTNRLRKVVKAARATEGKGGSVGDKT